MNKRWGELANKMGTVVEDIVAPSIRRLAREMFDCGELRQFWTRMSDSRAMTPPARASSTRSDAAPARSSHARVRRALRRHPRRAAQRDQVLPPRQ